MIEKRRSRFVANLRCFDFDWSVEEQPRILRYSQDDNAWVSGLWRHVAACGGMWRHVAACGGMWWRTVADSGPDFVLICAS
jgi:hypothetical protein